jgi:hypothetical protein
MNLNVWHVRIVELGEKVLVSGYFLFVEHGWNNHMFIYDEFHPHPVRHYHLNSLSILILDTSLVLKLTWQSEPLPVRRTKTSIFGSIRLYSALFGLYATSKME